MPEKSHSPTPWDRLLVGLESNWPSDRWKNIGVVVGCSGGADSVALLKLICDRRSLQPNAKGFVIAAHYNHGLRGAASDGDQAFVAELAETLRVRFHSEGPPEKPASDEASMRELRRAFFVRVAQSSGARYIATAHTADDNVETVLHHLMRGTGPSGLAGMSVSGEIGPHENAKDFVLVRPMLSMRRDQIREALQSIAQSWREDASNQNTDYRRNWIRQSLIPLIESEYPSAVSAMSRTIEIQQDWRRLVDRLAINWLHEHRLNTILPSVRCDPLTEPAIIIAALQHLWDLQGWARREMTSEHWRRLASTIQTAAPEKYSVPGRIEVIAENKIVTFQDKCKVDKDDAFF